jgi:predicted ribosome quality control (RQC) complex YloA/Tae2 family protein
MSYDGIMMHHVVNDLNMHLLNNRITKIYQLSNYDLLFQTRGKENARFLISTSPKYARAHRTLNDYEKPLTPPMFCMFLRKHLEGAIIKSILQHGNDRVFTITVETLNELGDLTKKHLIYEALGKDSNIILTDESYKILDVLKQSGPFDITARTLVATAMYAYPKDARVNPYDERALDQLFDSHHFESVHDYLSHLSGVSPLAIKEMQFRSETEKITNLKALKTIIHEHSPSIIEGKKSVYAPYTLTHLHEEATLYPDTTSLLDAFFYERDNQDKRKQKAKDIQSLVHKTIEKLKHKIEKLDHDLKKTSLIDTLKKEGELILSYQHLIKKGDRTLECIDYYTNQPIKISLDPTKTAIQNSEAYFKRYKKIKASIPHIHKQIRLAKDDLEYFYLLADQLNHASLSDIDSIRNELIDEGYIKKKHQKSLQKKATHITYIDALGTEIMVGKNNLQNSKITHELAKHFHIWFHVQNAPGSHVVVKQGFPLEETTIRTAAMLASYYSTYKHSSSVAVDYTEVKNIKKIPGKRSCFVRYTDQKTNYIDPDEAFIKTLTIKK